MFSLISTIISVVLYGIGMAADLGTILQNVYSLLVLVPTIAVATRRLHDTNRSGWWQLIALTLIGLMPLLIWAVQDSDAWSNRFGANPKGE